YVVLAQRRDPEGTRFLRVTLGADAEPAGVDETRCDRGHTLAVQHVVVHVLRHSCTQVRKALREADQPVELRLLLLSPKRRVVQVLPASGRVDAGGLQFGGRAWRDPDVFPRRRDDERPDPLELLRIGYAVSARVDVAEPSPRALPSPASPASHSPPLVSAPVDAKTIVVLEGDETGQELLEESLRVLAPDVTGLELEFPRFDL